LLLALSGCPGPGPGNNDKNDCSAAAAPLWGVEGGIDGAEATIELTLDPSSNDYMIAIQVLTALSTATTQAIAIAGSGEDAPKCEVDIASAYVSAIKNLPAVPQNAKTAIMAAVDLINIVLTQLGQPTITLTDLIRPIPKDRLAMIRPLAQEVL
jgi:hypothetical protein